MKLLDEAIKWYGMQHQEYVDNTQLYIFTSSQTSAVVVLDKYLEVVMVLMERNWLRFNPRRTEWLWPFGPLGPGNN